MADTLQTILIIDGDIAMDTGFSDAMKKDGVGIDVVRSATDAVARLQRQTYGLVITDERPIGAHNGDFFTTLRGLLPATPYIVTSGQGSVKSAVAAMQNGATDYLLKPIATDQLKMAARRALTDRRQVQAAPPPATTGRFKEIITQDPVMLGQLDLARRVAASNATVLILGESGTGKELMAGYIHRHGGDPGRPFVAMNCAALPETLAESELFGHEKGAFTGAISRKAGKFELADGGTLLLDEISEMTLPLQAKLLRVLQESTVDRVGGREPVEVQVRVIAICNVDLKAAVASGDFRRDLYYRINVIPLQLPPLRERRNDIALLVEYFLEKFSRRDHRKIHGIDPAAMDRLHRHPWPGNIRELENVMERAVLINTTGIIGTADLLLDSEDSLPPEEGALQVRAGMSVRDMEERLIERTLEEVDYNRAQAAEMLGISIRTLRNKLKEYQEKAAA